MFFDGEVKVYGSSIGAALTSMKGAHFPVAAQLQFPCTNNIAEYETYIISLGVAFDMNTRDLEVHGDSILIISQNTNEREVKKPEWIKYRRCYMFNAVSKSVQYIFFNHIHCLRNQFTDALAALAMVLRILMGGIISGQCSKQSDPIYDKILK